MIQIFTPLPVRPSDLFGCVPASEEHDTPQLKQPRCPEITATLEPPVATCPALRDFTENI